MGSFFVVLEWRRLHCTLTSDEDIGCRGKLHWTLASCSDGVRSTCMSTQES